MKNLLTIAVLYSLAFFKTSCGSINDVYGNNNWNNGVYIEVQTVQFTDKEKFTAKETFTKMVKLLNLTQLQ